MKVFKRSNPIKSARDGLRWYRVWRTLPVRAWIQAADAFRSEDFVSAKALYRDGLSKQPDHVASHSARLDLAYCHYRLDEFEDSLSELSFLISAGSDLRDAYILRSKIYLISGQLNLALLTAELCRNRFPNDSRLLAHYVHLKLLVDGDEELAQDMREQLNQGKSKLAVDDPDVVYIDTALAHIDIIWGDIRRAERTLARVLATGRAPFEALLLRGERLLAQGRVLPARELLVRAMRMSKKDPRPILLLSASYLRSGEETNFEYAEQLAEAACRISHWKNAECVAALARALEFKGEKAKAQLFLERIKQLPSAGEPQLSSPHSFSQIGRYQKVSNS